MKASPAPDGTLLLCPETPADWDMLGGIVRDGTGRGLAEAMGGLMEGSPAALDWHDYVVPELAETYSSQLEFIARAVGEAREDAQDGPGLIVIRREDADLWYGALNQARLALEERHQLAGATAVEDVMALPRPRREAYFRSHVYLQLQSMLLDTLMSP